jgi:broad-specificity NMP kinase/uncharacterized protein (UPF0218 family)
MIIAISGTPATGKTSVAKALAKRMKWPAYSLNEIAKQKNLYKGYDKKRKADIVDIKKLRIEVSKLAKKHKNFIIESHYAHEMPNDLVIILRTNPNELYKRMKEKKWWKEKIEENIEAEIMEVCKQEALEGNVVYEIDTTNKKPYETAEEIENFIKRYSLLEKSIKVPEEMKYIFRKPHGLVFEGSNKKTVSRIRKFVKNGFIISVGDTVSYVTTKYSLKPNIIIIDGYAKRKKFKKKINFHGYVINAKNPAGAVTKSLWKAIAKAIGIKEKVIIKVDGEEDLAVLPCAILAPNGSFILYGQPDKGIVCLKVDEKRRENAKKILKKIKSI